MTVGERRLKSEVASVELSLRKVRGLLWGMVSDMMVLVLVFAAERCCWSERLKGDVLEREVSGKWRRKGRRGELLSKVHLV